MPWLLTDFRSNQSRSEAGTKLSKIYFGDLIQMLIQTILYQNKSEFLSPITPFTLERIDWCEFRLLYL